MMAMLMAAMAIHRPSRKLGVEGYIGHGINLGTRGMS